MIEQTEEWEVDDGAVEIEQYVEQDIKILWVLRETNGSDFNFKKFLKNPKVYPKWKQTVGLVVKTSNAIFERLDGTKGNQYPKDVTRVMKKIAWINIKKTGGKANSNPNELKVHAKNNAGLIENQIKKLTPNILILAGTKGYVSDKVKNEISTLTGIETIVVNTYHTNQRTITHSEYIDSVVEIVNSTLKIKQQKS